MASTGSDTPHVDNDSVVIDEIHSLYATNVLNGFLKSVESVRETPFELPKTVSLIECSNGTKVYLVGTAHFSRESIADVRLTIKKTLPDIVVVELCRNRSHSMLLTEEDIKRQIQENSLTDFVKSLGLSNGVLQYLLLRFTNYVMEQIGMAPGGEFRAAFQEASKQPHCHLVLGDRPINITLRRAIDELGPWQKTKFFFALVFGFEKITPEDVEAMKSEDMLEQLMKTLAGDYPELMRTILDERDLYLARTIWEMCGFSSFHAPHSPYSEDCKESEESDTLVRNRKSEYANDEAVTDASHRDHKEAEEQVVSLATEKTPRSPPPTPIVPMEGRQQDDTSLRCCPEWPGIDVLPRVVVAVVGIGHIAGIKRAWHRAAQIDKEELCRLKPTSRSWTAFRWATRALFFSAAGLIIFGIMWSTYRVGSFIYTGVVNFQSKYSF